MKRKYVVKLNDYEIEDVQIRTKEDKVNICKMKNDDDTFSHSATVLLPNKGEFNKDELRNEDYNDMNEHDYAHLNNLKRK